MPTSSVEQSISAFISFRKMRRSSLFFLTLWHCLQVSKDKSGVPLPPTGLAKWKAGQNCKIQIQCSVHTPLILCQFSTFSSLKMPSHASLKMTPHSIDLCLQKFSLLSTTKPWHVRETWSDYPAIWEQWNLILKPVYKFETFTTTDFKDKR